MKLLYKKLSIILILLIIIFNNINVFADQNYVYRVAHQKNSHEKVIEANKFDAIEVDLRYYDNGDFHLYHNNDHDYTLNHFLEDCKNSGQIAMLDMKYQKNLDKLINLIYSKGMLDNTIFQCGTGKLAKRLCDINNNCHCWLLNGAGSEKSVRFEELTNYSSYLEGINIFGDLLSDDEIPNTINKIHNIKGHNGNIQVCFFAYGKRSDVYHKDELLIFSGTDWLMTDICPTGYNKKITKSTSIEEKENTINLKDVSKNVIKLENKLSKQQEENKIKLLNKLKSYIVPNVKTLKTISLIYLLKIYT